MKRPLFFLLLLFFCNNTFAQKPQWACKLVETNDPNKGDYAPKEVLYIPDAYPSGGTDNGYTYCLGFTYEKTKPKKFPIIKFKLEYCIPIIAEQIVIVESANPGSITKVTIEDTKGKKTVVYKGKAAGIADKQRLLYIPFNRTANPIQYVSIEADPGKVPSVSCLDGIALCPAKGSIEIKINLGADLHFISKSQPLSNKINSAYQEVLPVISPNNKYLYFDRKDHPQNVRNPEKLEEFGDDIYISKRDANGNWVEATNGGKPLNNYSHNFVNSISPDGNTMLLANRYKSDGSPAGPGASITKKIKGQGWSMPEDLLIKDFKNKNQFVSFFMANTNNVLLMAIEGDDGVGEKDICVSFVQPDGSWSKPMNIGEDINTILDEYSPVLASDNVTMYFSSKGHYGYGGYDIFVTKRLDDTWKRWSKPINLGPEINNLHSNIGFSIAAAGKEVYTYGWNGKDGQADIFVTELGDAKSIQPNPVYLVSGRVFDAKTKKPIQASILYELLSNGSKIGTASSDPDNGEYSIVLPVGKEYGYFAQAKGYIAVHENLEIPANSNYTEFNKDLYLVPIETGQTIKLNNIFFVQSKPQLIESSFPELDRMVEILRNNPNIEIRLEGHTDNQGDAKKNVELSQQRVDVVKEYLVSKGITSKRISTKAFGGTKPIASNAKEETRKLNRRVEFTITKH